MSSIMRARSALTGRWEESEVIGGPLSSRRLLDLRCSGSDAPIVTPYRSPTHRHRQKCTRLDAALPRERVRSLPRSRHSTVQSGLYFAAILIAHLLGSRELLPGLARLWMWISLLSPHRKAASQLLMEQVS